MAVKSIFSKLIFICLTTLLFFLLIHQVLGASLDVGIEYGESTQLGTTDIRVTIAQIIKTSLGIFGIIAIVLTIYGGILYLTSQGDPEKQNQAKKVLISAAIGLAIILSAYAITSFILKTLQIQGSGNKGSAPAENQNKNIQVPGNENIAPENQNIAQENPGLPPVTSGNYLIGDADGNGYVTTLDYDQMETLVRGGAANCVDKSNEAIDCKLVMDLDGNSQVNFKDLNLLHKKVWATPLYIEGDGQGDKFFGAPDSTIMNSLLRGGTPSCISLEKTVIDCKAVMDLNNDDQINNDDLILLNIKISGTKFIPGDADGDGHVTTLDYKQLENYLRNGTATCVNLDNKPADCLMILDIDGNLKVNYKDLNEAHTTVFGTPLFLDGDTDGDSFVTSADADNFEKVLMKLFAECHDLNNEPIDCKASMDMDGNSILDNNDRSLLLQKIMGQDIYLPGDANNDGFFGTTDLTIISNILRGELTSCKDNNNEPIDCKIVMDLNLDGTIDYTDYNLLIMKTGAHPLFTNGDADGDGVYSPADSSIMDALIKGFNTTCNDRQLHIIDCHLSMDLDKDGEFTQSDEDLLIELSQPPAPAEE